MANMSYCRFQNTLQDLRDCFNEMDEAFSEGMSLAEFANTLSEDERWAMHRIIELCIDISQVANEMENVNA